MTEHVETATAQDASSQRSERLASLDAYRGFTMLALALTVPNWSWQERIAEAHEGLRPLMDQFEHAAWRGCTLWDLIQPSFMFMVGVSMAYSVASRKRRGATDAELWQHAAFRAAALVLLGVFLRSLGRSETNWTLEDVVSQIGLGYLPLFWLATKSPRLQALACVALLAAVWLLFAIWPLPGPDFDLADNQAVLHYEGFWAHWNQNTGPGHWLDRWLLNLPPRSEPFVANAEGYNTLNFLPSIATMAAGLLAGEWLRGDGARGPKGVVLLASGFGLALAGLALDFSGACPLIKKLWTPSFALASSGACLAILVVLYAVIDLGGFRRWAWPAEVVGRNPLAMYVMTWTAASWVLTNLTTHLGSDAFALLGDSYAPLLGNLATGGVLFLICWWMDRNRVYVRL